ncbi:hypothetical protein ABEF95_011769 [Exophiala dermatitidis]
MCSRGPSTDQPFLFPSRPPFESGEKQVEADERPEIQQSHRPEPVSRQAEQRLHWGNDSSPPLSASGNGTPDDQSDDTAGMNPVDDMERSFSFSTVIEHDHATVNKYAVLLQKARTRDAQIRLLGEVAWRLVRHDISEELVMRPAFIEHLGPHEGQSMAEHDRLDHERAKDKLLALFERVRTASCYPKESTSTADGTCASTSHNRGDGRQVEGLDFESEFDFSTTINSLFVELLQHMKIESGEQIPMLERMLDPCETRRLGREYIRTQVLTPDLEIVDNDNNGDDEDGGTSPTSRSSKGTKRRKVWRDIADYVRTDRAGFREIYTRIKNREVQVLVPGVGGSPGQTEHAAGTAKAVKL